MTRPVTEPRDDDLAALDVYARFYAPLALAAAALLFLPMYDDIVQETEDGSVLTRHYGTLWEIADRGGQGASLGIILMATFIVLVAIAAFRPRSGGLPIAMACVAAVVVVLLVFAPKGDTPPVPDLSQAGTVGVVFGICVVVLGIAHAAQYFAIQRRRDQRLSSAYGYRIDPTRTEDES